MKNRREGTEALTLKEKRADEKAREEGGESQAPGGSRSKKTLSEYWRESYSPAAQRTKKQWSWASKEQHFRTSIEPILGKLPLRSIALPLYRHTVAIRLAQRLGTRDLRDVMGWRTVSMTMRYVHSNKDAKMRVLSTLGAELSPRRCFPFARTSENRSGAV